MAGDSSEGDEATAAGQKSTGNIPPPKSGFIAALRKLPNRVPPRWTNADGSRMYEWDRLHGEWEVYNARGRHLGAASAATGVMIKAARKDRSIDV
jgi:hypothetical protein